MTEITGIKACVFDAYGTLFDVNAAAAHLKNELGGKDAKLAEIWRLKQLQYSWLRTLMEGCYVDFWQVTQDGLDFAMEAVGLKDDALRKSLKGSDLFISFSSGSMAAFALNWVANLRKAGIDEVLLGSLDDSMLKIAAEQVVVGGAVMLVDAAAAALTTASALRRACRR